MEAAYIMSTVSYNETVSSRPSQAPATPEEAHIENFFGVILGINKHYLWVLFALGFPGNMAAIITISRMRSIGSFPFFVVTLAVADMVAISVKLLMFQLLSHHVHIGATGCCVLKFLGSWSTAYSSWVLVLMALERWAAVRFPLRMTLHNGCYAHKIVGVLWAVGLVMALLYLPQLWTSDNVVQNNYMTCEYKAEYMLFMKVTYHWLSAAVYAFLPFVLLMVLNCMIARQIRASLRVRSVMRNLKLMPYSHGCFDMSIQRQVNLMLLSATMVFVLFTFPICLYLIADHYWVIPQKPFLSRQKAVKFLLQQLAFVLVDSTHSVNFYLYFLTARRFRYHCLRLLACRRARKWFSIKTLCKQARSSNNQSEMEEL